MRKLFLLPFVLISLFTNSQTPNLVKDIYPGIKSAFYDAPYGLNHALKPINNGVIFTASPNGTLSQLWYSDGSNSGTYQLDPNLWMYSTLSTDNTDPKYFNGKYYFSASTPTYGTEMYMTDGTTAGTKVLKDIVAGSGSGGGKILNITANKFYYIANDGVTGNELYISDGTTPGTSFLKDMVPGVASPTVQFYNNTNTINDNFYFISTTATEGTELWFTDGTTSGTKLVSDIWPGMGNSVPTINFKRLKGNNNDLFFVANNGINGEELWFSNGSTASLVKDINPGSAGSYYQFLAFENNTLFFLTDDGTTGQELWRSDGTSSGTYLLHDFTPGINAVPYTYKTFNNKFYYYNSGSKAIWETNGTIIGTSSVTIPATNTATLVTANSDMLVFNNVLYFTNHRFPSNLNLWGHDSIFFYKITSGLGSLSNFAIVKNEKNPDGQCNTGYFDSITPNLFRYQYSYFGLTDVRITYFSDGTSINTNQCGYYAWAHTSNDCYEKEILSINNNVIYWGSATISGSRVMYSNFIPSGSAQTINNSITYQICSPVGYFKQQKTHGNKIYFRGNITGMGEELCVTDGTSSGTSLVLDIFPGANSALRPEASTYYICHDEFVSASSGAKFFFLANDGVVGTELWCIGGFTGIEENRLNINFNMYPNPTDNNVNLNLNGSFIGGSIQLFDAIGKLIQTQPIKNISEKIDLNLNSGIYFVKATTKEGISKTEKLIIE
jgi:ELWxxDGT repeat protein